MYILVIYWIIINFIGILSMWADKKKAQRRKWRIPEHTLLSIAILGGSVGSFFRNAPVSSKNKTFEICCRDSCHLYSSSGTCPFCALLPA